MEQSGVVRKENQVPADDACLSFRHASQSVTTGLIELGGGTY